MSMDVLIKSIRSIKYIMDSNRTKWFVCFGVMLGILRDKQAPPDNDIDIGVYYEDYDFERIKRSFAKMGYAPNKIIYPDTGGQPLYSHYQHSSFPDICLFAWYLHKEIRYHTYDYYEEGKKVLKKYRFKGIKAEYLDETIQVPMDKKRVVPGGEIVFPKKYGSCLDEWYPNWLEPRKEQSHSKYIVELKSMKEWKKIK